jgi:hypothetical protein
MLCAMMADGVVNWSLQGTRPIIVFKLKAVFEKWFSMANFWSGTLEISFKADHEMETHPPTQATAASHTLQELIYLSESAECKFIAVEIHPSYQR